MINLKDRDEMWPSVVTVCSVIVLAGTLVLMLIPQPSSKGVPELVRKQSLQIKIDKKKADVIAEQNEKNIEATTWSGNPQDVGTAALRRVTELAKQRDIKLGAFRPQRSAVADNLDTLPFTVTVDGKFVDVLGFERDIEDPANRLAVSLFQISTSDPNTDKVTANVAVVAYLRPKPPASLSQIVKRGATHA